MEYTKFILNALVDEYEKKGYFLSNDLSSKIICFDVYKKIKEYPDRYNYDTSCEIESAVETLLSYGFIYADNKDNMGYYHKVFLNIEAIDKAYSFLNRTSANVLHSKVKHTLEKHLSNAEKGSVVYNYCMQQLSNLEKNKSLENQIGFDNEKLENILTTLNAIFRLEKETYIRNFSEAVFHDSKKFTKFQSSVISILKKYSSEPLDDDKKVLEWFNLFKNPIFIYIKGDCTINFNNGKIDTKAVKGGVALSPDSIPDIQCVQVHSRKLITVENLTTYHDTSENNAVVIYLGGFHNSVRTHLLKSIYLQNSHIDYFHKGDLDIFGFLILENLKSKTGINFEPYEMDLELLIKCYKSNFFKPLNNTDIKRSHDPVLDKYRTIINFMVENNCKVEQESIEAMKLNV